MIQPKKIQGRSRLRVIYTLAAGAPQFSCADINRRSTAIKALSITTGLTKLYLDVSFLSF